jgi:hypothetical protein
LPHLDKLFGFCLLLGKCGGGNADAQQGNQGFFDLSFHGFLRAGKKRIAAHQRRFNW